MYDHMLCTVLFLIQLVRAILAAPTISPSFLCLCVCVLALGVYG